MVSDYKTGVLLTNLGSPDEPTAPAIRRFLKQFLSDPLVVQLPRWLWLPLLNLVILNLRSFRVAHAYQSIWTPEGSPLIMNSFRQQKQLQEKLNDQNYQVALGMRYGNPSLKQSLEQLKSQDVNNIIVLPLYPQYSMTTTKTTVEEIGRLLHTLSWQPTMNYIEHYYNDAGYIDALANSVKAFWESTGQVEKLMFSFHGLPQQNIDKGDPYFSHCQQTASLLADKLQLKPEQWKMTFQSRFGRAEWIKPYTHVTLQEWGEQGIRNVAVLCPGFPSDCLETLEEIRVENKNIFIEAGGKEFHYIPALNDSEDHITALAGLVHNTNKKGA